MSYIFGLVQQISVGLATFRRRCFDPFFADVDKCNSVQRKECVQGQRSLTGSQGFIRGEVNARESEICGPTYGSAPHVGVKLKHFVEIADVCGTEDRTILADAISGRRGDEVFNGHKVSRYYYRISSLGVRRFACNS